MKRLIPCAFVLLLSACGKPSGLSDEDYEQYNQYGAPKILYSCTSASASVKAPEHPYDLYRAKEEGCKKLATYEDRLSCLQKGFESTPKSVKEQLETTVRYSVGVGVGATYNKLLNDAKYGCDEGFKVLEKKE